MIIVTIISIIVIVISTLPPQGPRAAAEPHASRAQLSDGARWYAQSPY